MTAYEDAQRAYDAKTKPRRSLGRLEELGCRIAGIRGSVPERLECAIVVAAGDHGVTAEGVSAYPSEVTAQMLANFESGGAAINVLAGAAGARLVVVDAGVGTPTANFVHGPAMTAGECEASIELGRKAVRDLGDVDVVAVGEMGIGNTTSASALTAARLGIGAALVCGPGTGLDPAGIAHKVNVVERGLAANEGADPLAALGGFEIAVLVGVMLECAERGIVVLLDGFITGAAALVAAQRDPRAADVMIASHRSPEPGHRLVLEALGLRPLLELELRLGEGSGAALALPLLHASIAILREMATFESAGVTDAGR